MTKWIQFICFTRGNCPSKTHKVYDYAGSGLLVNKILLITYRVPLINLFVQFVASQKWTKLGQWSNVSINICLSELKGCKNLLPLVVPPYTQNHIKMLPSHFNIKCGYWDKVCREGGRQEPNEDELLIMLLTIAFIQPNGIIVGNASDQMTPIHRPNNQALGSAGFGYIN